LWSLALGLLSVGWAVAQTPVYTGPCTRRTSIVLSEILYHPPGEATASTEFIELYNSSPIGEDLSGWKLRGDVDFTIPDGTLLAGGRFLVIAANPDALRATGVTGTILGPWTGVLSNNKGTVRVRKASGGIVLETNYDDVMPWPLAADGAGHSLVLARPAFGESRPEAWAASRNLGGSPGAADPSARTALEAVVISEIFAVPDANAEEFVEFHNPGAAAADLEGCFLTQNGITGYTMPVGTVLAPGGYLAFTGNVAGFAFDDSGDSITLRAPNGGKVIAALRFRGQENSRPWGGINDWRELSNPTPGSVNAAPFHRPVVINEIHYHPSDDNDAAEFVELHNHGNEAVDLSGWQLKDAVGFTFPIGTSIEAGGFLVVAKDRAHLLALHSALNPLVTLGDYSGNLSNGGERLELVKPQDIVADVVTYFDGGRWPSRADGGGTSLQLLDPRADNALAPSWGAADESGSATTITVEHTGVLDLGHPKTTSATRFFIMLLGEGEAVVDDVEVLVGGQNRVVNGGFAGGLTGWNLFGTHRPSVVENGALRVVATDGGDLANLIETTLSAPITPGTTATLRARVRWISGHPEILLGLDGGWLEAAGTLPVPGDVGTPGAPNAGAGNVGPALAEVSHSPLLPQAGEAITVTARVADPDGIASVRLRYRLDPATSIQQITMSDDGVSQGDARAGDGFFTGRIPAQSAGTMIAFHLLSVDSASPGVISRFPVDATTRECLVRVGEVTPSGDLGTYRIWITRANHDAWRDRERSSNLDLDATFVSDDRVFYNCGTHYAGSQNGVTIYDSPTGNPCGYNISLPADEVFLNTQKLTLDRETTRDVTRQRERLMFWFLDKLGLPNLHRRYVHVYLNGVKRDQFIMEDVQKPNSDVMAEWFNDKGRLTKTNPWFEFDPSGNVQTGSSLANRLEHFRTAGAALKLPRYRRTWSHGSGHVSEHDYSGIVALIDAAQTPDAGLAAAMNARADMRQWMRTFAMNDLASYWDTFGNPGSKNAYLFESLETGRWSVVTWDMDVGLGVFNDPVNAALFPSNVDPAIIRMYARPEIVRDYWQGLYEALGSFFVAAGGTEINRILQETYDALIANGAAVTSPFSPSGPYNLSVTDWISQRRAFLQGELAGKSAAFSATGPASSANVFATLTGSAPLATSSITVNGVPLVLTWTGISQWSAQVALLSGANVLAVQGLDAAGAPTGSATVNIQFTGSVQWPALRINEWMAVNPASSGILDPADGKADDWLELYNPTGAAASLEGWYLSDDPASPLLYRIPAGFLIPAAGFRMVWADDETAQNAPATRQDIHVAFKLSSNGETVILSAPDGSEIDRVVFGEQTSGIALRRIPDGGVALTYTLAPTPGASNPSGGPSPVAPAVTSASLVGNNVVLEFLSTAGTVYTLESSPDLGLWTTSGAPLAGAGGPMTLSSPGPPAARVFFRIRSY
jgi:hypothetical protein